MRAAVFAVMVCACATDNPDAMDVGGSSSSGGGGESSSGAAFDYEIECAQDSRLFDGELAPGFAPPIDGRPDPDEIFVFIHDIAEGAPREYEFRAHWEVEDKSVLEDHTHTIEVSASDWDRVAAGETVEIESSTELSDHEAFPQEHTHTVSLGC